MVSRYTFVAKIAYRVVSSAPDDKRHHCLAELRPALVLLSVQVMTDVQLSALQHQIHILRDINRKLKSLRQAAAKSRAVGCVTF